MAARLPGILLIILVAFQRAAVSLRWWRGRLDPPVAGRGHPMAEGRRRDPR